jgi:hypothetical protein
MVAFLGDPSTFSEYALIRTEVPTQLFLLSVTEDARNNEVKANIEAILGIPTRLLAIPDQSFQGYLNFFYNLLKGNYNEKYLFIGTGMPTEALLAIFVLGSFFEVWIIFKEFIIPNQAALLLAKKQSGLLRIIQQDEPSSLEELLDILSEQKQYKILNRKNMRAKVSYTLGILRRNGLIAVHRGARGKLKTKLTLIGKELLENIIS